MYSIRLCIPGELEKSQSLWCALKLDITSTDQNACTQDADAQRDIVTTSYSQIQHPTGVVQCIRSTWPSLHHMSQPTHNKITIGVDPIIVSDPFKKCRPCEEKSDGMWFCILSFRYLCQSTSVNISTDGLLGNIPSGEEEAKSHSYWRTVI